MMGDKKEEKERRSDNKMGMQPTAQCVVLRKDVEDNCQWRRLIRKQDVV